MFTLENLVLNAGLAGIYQKLKENLGWVLLAMLLIGVITVTLQRSLRAIISLAIFYLVCAVLFFGAERLFGQSGTLTNTGSEILINTIYPLFLR